MKAKKIFLYILAIIFFLTAANYLIFSLLLTGSFGTHSNIMTGEEICDKVKIGEVCTCFKYNPPKCIIERSDSGNK